MKPFLKILPKLLFLVAAVVLILFITKKNPPSENETGKKNLILIQYNDSPLSELSEAGIRKGLTDLGWTEGKEYGLRVQNAQGDIATLNMMVDGAWNDRPDLIFVTSTPTLQATLKKIKDIPVVFSVVADPVVAGAGNSFTDHLPNITGISTLGDYQGMSRWLKRIMPQVKTIGTLYSPGEANSVKNMNDLKMYAEQEGIRLLTVPVNSSAEVIDASRALMTQHPDAICQIIDNLTSSAFAAIAKISKEYRIPLFGFVSDQAEKGAILVVSRNYEQAGLDAVQLARKIWEGTPTAEIPFEFVSRTDIYINPSAAAFYGITLPDTLLNHPDVIKVP